LGQKYYFPRFKKRGGEKEKEAQMKRKGKKREDEHKS